MIFTDPPYGHNNNADGDLLNRWEAAKGHKKQSSVENETVARAIANDGAEDTDRLIQWLFKASNTILNSGGCCCCCGGGGGPDPQFARWSMYMDQMLEFKQMVIWDKGPIGMGWHYRRSYETILVGNKKGAACKWYDTTNRVENIIRPGYKGISKIIPSAEQHATPKPPELASHFIKLHTQVGETVLDPFMGGGSTGLAAQTLGRKFIGIELDPKWFDLSCKRIDRLVRSPNLLRFADPASKTQKKPAGLL